MTTPLLRIDRLGKTYPSRQGPVLAIDEVTFDVTAGEFVSVVGPSGCGKTTLMMGIAGLRSISKGDVQLAGRTIDGPPEGLAVVFQDYSRSLFPWLTVHKNVALPLKDQGISKAERRDIVARSLHAVGLDGVEGLHPWQLSGGMQQRVAIARGLAQSPKILLMDEPFASVDAQTRANLEDLMLDVWEEFGMTIVFVTHDIDEAVYLADRVVVLSPGPSRVKEIVPVPIPRPRDQIATKQLTEFTSLRSKVFELVMGARRDDNKHPSEDGPLAAGGGTSEG